MVEYRGALLAAGQRPLSGFPPLLKCFIPCFLYYRTLHDKPTQHVHLLSNIRKMEDVDILCEIAKSREESLHPCALLHQTDPTRPPEKSSRPSQTGSKRFVLDPPKQVSSFSRTD